MANISCRYHVSLRAENSISLNRSIRWNGQNSTSQEFGRLTNTQNSIVGQIEFKKNLVTYDAHCLAFVWPPKMLTYNRSILRTKLLVSTNKLAFAEQMRIAKWETDAPLNKIFLRRLQRPHEILHAFAAGSVEKPLIRDGFAC